jgi:hypothetical protein
MMRLRRAVLLSAVLVCAPHVARAQVGEVHIGPLASYGLPDSFGPGGGLVVGVAAGRLVYIGLRWAYQSGSTQVMDTAATPVAVTSRVQLFAFDFGLLFPVGAFEIVPGISLGAARYAQKADLATAGQRVVSEHDMAFLAAPSLSVYVRLGSLLVIPELQYLLGEVPDLPRPVEHRGPVASIRFVVPFEVSRIRH